MLDIMFWKTVFLCAVALGLIIFVHELGHFLVAKACGVRCDKFYIGFDFFGLKLLKFKYGETEYGIGIFPLGGYVKMLGQEDNPGELKERLEKAKAAREMLAKNADAPVDKEIILSEERIAEAEKMLNDPRSYQSKSVPQRLAIIVAGVTMNVIFAFLAAVVAFMLGTYKAPPVVGNVAAGQAAWEAGLQAEDTLLSIHGNELRYFDDIPKNVTLGSDLEKGVPVVYRRKSYEAALLTEAFPKKYTLAPLLGATSSSLLVLSEGIPVMPTSGFDAEDKLLAGDMLVEVNRQPVKDYLDYQKAIQKMLGEKITFRFARPTPEARVQWRETLKKISRDDVAGWERLREDYLNGATFVEVTLEPQRGRNFGIVWEMGTVQGTRLEAEGPSPARQAGIVAGDRLLGLEIDGAIQPIGDPMTLAFRIHQLSQKQDSIRLQIQKKAGKEEVVEMAFQKDATPAMTYMPGSGIVIPELGLSFYPSEKVASVLPQSEAEKAGIQAGDLIHAIQILHELPPNAELSKKEELFRKNFSTRTDWFTFRPEACMIPLIYDEWIQKFPLINTYVNLKVERDGKVSEYKLPLSEYVDAYVLNKGLNFEARREFIHEDLGESIVLGGRETWNSLTMVFQMLEKLFSGQVSVKGLGGPVLIAKMAYYSASDGLAALLMFSCLISANLAVMNLLPIPVLDGGHVVFLLYEGITGRAPNENLMIALTYAGLLLFLGLTIFVFALDLGFISRL